MILIDGMNLLYKFPDLEGMMYEGRLNEARDGLVQILKEFRQIKKEHVRVVFDGKRRPSDNTRTETISRIEICYSHDLSADFIIKEYIKHDENPRMVTVVTSDKDIIFYVNRFKARVMQSEKFADYVKETIETARSTAVPEKDTNPAISDDEMRFWEKMFSRRKKG